MKINEFVTQEELSTIDEKASRSLCISTKSNKELGASNLSSCKSQGLRAREGGTMITMNKKRGKTVGKKLKGEKYGGPVKKNT
jgi:hypothetical protein